MSADLTALIFTDEDAARAHFEALRWADGRACPHCGVVDESTLMKGKTTRPGLYKCRPCRKPFSATMGTIYERSHIPLHKWLLATHLMCASKKGVSALQLHRMLGFGSYKTAWFMAHRIRAAMVSNGEPMGGEGGIVEADETYYGSTEGALKNRTRGKGGKRVIVSLVQRGGNVRSFHVARASIDVVKEIIVANVKPETVLHTDESPIYPRIGVEFSGHDTVKHSAGEYARGIVHTNTIEGYFSIFKRGMRGIYQHCKEKHLHRYLSEFDFRYNQREALGVNDKGRAVEAVKGTVGKRLTYKKPDGGLTASA